VTEAEWLGSTDACRMLNFLGAQATDRKRRLFGCACCRGVSHLLGESGSWSALEIAERYTDGTASATELDEAWRMAFDAVNSIGRTARLSGREDWKEHDAALAVAAMASVDASAPNTAAQRTAFAVGARWHTVDEREARVSPDGRRKAELLRDIAFNPFRPEPAIDPAWLVWRNGTVRRLARAAYDERRLPEGTLDAARLALLADALEDAGCADAELLGHLRGPVVHVRGCWAVDLILAKG
jgi:hypothetical protein